MIEMLKRDSERLAEELLSRPTPVEIEREELRREYEGRVARASDMLQREYTAEDSLLEPILPRQGVAALVGSSDSGKSTFLRGLAMAVVRGDEEYVGFKLHAKNRKALYISTEDDEAALARLMRLQVWDGDAERYKGLHFIFDTDNLLETIELGLESYTPDVVIVDAFADLYTGPMNENNRVRSFLNLFSQLAVKYHTLFIFLHHTGKRTEAMTPSKHNAIGSQGFEAKMRLMMELRRDPERHDIRHLCIVKGNYLSEEYKHDSYELRFTPLLTFEATGERVPFSELRERDPESESAEQEKLELIRSLREQGKTYPQIAKQLGYKDESSIRKWLKRNTI